MERHELGWVLGILALVSLAAWVGQHLQARRVEGQLYAKLTSDDRLLTVHYAEPKRRKNPVASTSSTPPGPLELESGEAARPTLQLEGTSTLWLWTGKAWVPATHWDVDKDHWECRAKEVRRHLLQRTQETADKWRNVFAGLLGIFGAVLVFNKPNPPTGEDRGEVEVLLVFLIAFALHAVAYTGWAAAGLPKMLVDLNAATALRAEMRQGAKALSRLRVGLLCGVLAAVLLTVLVSAVV